MAQRTFDRTKTLLDTKVVTQSQLDDAQTKLIGERTATTLPAGNTKQSASGIAQAEAQANLIESDLQQHDYKPHQRNCD